MNDDDGLRARQAGWWRIPALGVTGLALLALGVVAGAAWNERRVERQEGAAARSQPANQPLPSTTPSIAKPGAEPVEVPLSPEAMERAGIATAPVRSDVVENTTTVSRDEDQLVGGGHRPAGAPRARHPRRPR